MFADRDLKYFPFLWRDNTILFIFRDIEIPSNIVTIKVVINLRGFVESK
jgi:hypothetical protein